MKLVVSINGQEAIKASTDAEAMIAKALTAAMKEVGKEAADAANANIHAAGFASRKWELKAENFPKSGGNTLLPEVWLHSTANFEDVFTEGAQIRGNPLLWLPLPTVPMWPGDSTRQMSPSKYVQTIGPLVSMERKGRPPMLGAPVQGNARSQAIGRRLVSKRRLRVGSFAPGFTIVPLFVGVPAAVIEKKFDVDGAVQKVIDKFPGLYLQNENK
jgi:hypothetical protein